MHPRPWRGPGREVPDLVLDPGCSLGCGHLGCLRFRQMAQRMQRAGAGRAFSMVAVAAQCLEALREAVLDQPGPEGRATRVRAAEQFDAMGAAIAVDVVDAQVLRNKRRTGRSGRRPCRGARYTSGVHIPSLPEIRLGPTVYTCSSALRLRATGPPWSSCTRPTAVRVLARQGTYGDAVR